MIDYRENIPHLGLSVLTIALSIWLMFFNSDEADVPFQLFGPPEHFIKSLEHRQFDANGQLTYLIAAEQLDVHPEGALLSETTLTIHNANATTPDWVLKASTILWNKAAQQFDLNTRVSLERPAYPPYPDIHVKTEHLTYYSEDQRIIGDKEVTLQGDGYKITASQLTANAIDGQLKLHNNVRGMHDLP